MIEMHGNDTVLVPRNPLGGRDVNVFSAAVPKRHAPRDNIARDL